MYFYACPTATDWHRPWSADLEPFWLPMIGNTRIRQNVGRANAFAAGCVMGGGARDAEMIGMGAVRAAQTNIGRQWDVLPRRSWSPLGSGMRGVGQFRRESLSP